MVIKQAFSLTGYLVAGLGIEPGNPKPASPNKGELTQMKQIASCLSDW